MEAWRGAAVHGGLGEQVAGKCRRRVAVELVGADDERQRAARGFGPFAEFALGGGEAAGDYPVNLVVFRPPHRRLLSRYLGCALAAPKPEFENALNRFVHAIALFARRARPAIPFHSGFPDGGTNRQTPIALQACSNSSLNSLPPASGPKAKRTGLLVGFQPDLTSNERFTCRETYARP